MIAVGLMCECSRQATLLVMVGLLLFGFVFVHQKKFDSPTPVSRLDLLHALVTHRTVCIDVYHTNTTDKAVFKGHYYSDKAPGTVVAALPASVASLQILKWANIPLDSPKGWLISSWITCACSIALISALGGVALFVWLRAWLSQYDVSSIRQNEISPSQAALVTVFAISFGGAPLPYSTMLFSHAMVFGLLAIAIWALRLGLNEQKSALKYRTSEDPDLGGLRHGVGEAGLSQSEVSNVECGVTSTKSGTSNPDPGTHVKSAVSNQKASTNDYLASFCCGFALSSEYTSGLIILGLVIWRLSEDWQAGFNNPALGDVRERMYLAGLASDYCGVTDTANTFITSVINDKDLPNLVRIMMTQTMNGFNMFTGKYVELDKEALQSRLEMLRRIKDDPQTDAILQTPLKTAAVMLERKLESN